MSRRPRAADLEAEEAPPEADRLEGTPHPRFTEDIFGQGVAEAELANALASGRMHHAWLLTGREGIGKATLAYRFARAALANASESAAILPGTLAVGPETIAAKQVRSLSHPGLILIRRPWQRENKRLAQVITVDEVRRLKSFLQHSAGQGCYRVVIVDRAEEMNEAAANALLKSLEAAVVAAGGKMPAGEQAELVATMADGSVRRALQLIAGGAVELHGKIVDLLMRLPQLDYEAVHKLAEAAGAYGADQEFHSFFALLSDIIARALRSAATGDPAPASESAFANRHLPPSSASQTLANWAGAWQVIGQEKADTLALNLDRKALIVGAFGRLQAVSQDRPG